MAANLTFKFTRPSKYLVKTKYATTQYFYSTTAKPKLTSRDKSIPSATIKISKDIQKYFENEEKINFMNIIPEKYLKKKQKIPDHFYLTDSTVAQTIANHVKKHSTTQTFVEVNPGLGILTKELLKNDNLKQLFLYETNDGFIKNLKNINSLTNAEVFLRKGDIINMHKLAYQDKIDNKERVSKLLDGIPKKRWDERNLFILFCYFYRILIDFTYSKQYNINCKCWYCRIHKIFNKCSYISNGTFGIGSTRNVFGNATPIIYCK